MAALLPLFRHAAGTATAVADHELLDRFTTGRDEAAFAELVRRHGPVVFRVCRRLVGADGAEDAFQATFLVLATRLDAARAAGSVGGWLVGVAGRVARQMRRAAVRSSLGTRTVAAVFDFLTGGTGAARSVPVVVAKGVAMTMFTRKLTHLMAVVAAGLIGVGVVLAGDEKPQPKPQAELAPPPK